MLGSALLRCVARPGYAWRPLGATACMTAAEATMVVTDHTLPRSALVLDAKPAMTFIVSAKCFGNDGVCKGKEGCVLASCSLQGQEALQVLVVQHVLHSVPGDISAYKHSFERVSIDIT